MEPILKKLANEKTPLNLRWHILAETIMLLLWAGTSGLPESLGILYLVEHSLSHCFLEERDFKKHVEKLRKFLFEES